jgi:hypothetical protein
MRKGNVIARRASAEAIQFLSWAARFPVTMAWGETGLLPASATPRGRNDGDVAAFSSGPSDVNRQSGRSA